MTESFDVLLSEIGDLQLPALATTKRRFLQLIDRPTTGLADLGEVLVGDPGLSLRLVKELARSPRAAELDSISPVWMMNLLGLAQVREMTLAVPVLEERYREPALSGLRACYSLALHASRYAERLAVLSGNMNYADEALLALLQNLGEMALWARRPGTLRALALDAERPEELDQPLFRAIGMTAGQLGEALARRWKLPKPFQRVQCFSNSHAFQAQLPLLANALARAGMRDWQSDATLELIDLIAEFTHANVDMVRGLIHKDTAEVARDLISLGLPHCADRLLLPPGCRPPPPPWVHSKPVPKAPLPTSTPTPTPTPTPVPAPPPVAAPPNSNPLQQALSQVMRRMREELQLNRVMFAMLTPDRQSIRARYIAEVHHSGLSSFLVNTQHPNLFSMLLNRPNAVWVHGANRPKYQAHIPEAVIPLMDPESFFLATAVVKGKPIGIFYADGDGKVLVDEQFAGFKQLSLEAASLFEGGR